MPGFLDDLTGVSHRAYEAGLVRLSFAVAAVGDLGQRYDQGEQTVFIFGPHSVLGIGKFVHPYTSDFNLSGEIRGAGPSASNPSSWS